MVSIPVRLPLEGCKGHQSDTYDVDTNDFAVGLFDLFQFPENGVNMASRNTFNTGRTLGNTRSGTLQRPRRPQRCACGRFWESGQTQWVNGGRRLDILEDPFCRAKIKRQNRIASRHPKSKTSIHPFSSVFRSNKRETMSQNPSSGPNQIEELTLSRIGLRMDDARGRLDSCRPWRMMFVSDCLKFGISALFDLIPKIIVGQELQELQLQMYIFDTRKLRRCNARKETRGGNLGGRRNGERHSSNQWPCP